MPEAHARHREKSRKSRPGVSAVDVARLIGVSQSTVSRAFSLDGAVSRATRQKVFETAARIGYSPNAIARSLITSHTGLIGIVMGDILNPFYPNVLEQFTGRLQELGRKVLLFSVTGQGDVDDALPLVLQYQVDAVIVTSASLSASVADVCVRQGTPVVLFNRYVRDSQAHSVSCDNLNGARLVAEELVQAGHRRIAYIAGKENTSTNADRSKGFSERLNELGIPLWACSRGEYDYGTTYASTVRLLSAEERPDAIFCANDIMALGALDAARKEFGLRIPLDLSIIGFDDIPMADWPSYDLTTVRQPVPEMIEATLELLIHHPPQPAESSVHRRITGLLVRRSSARLSG